MPKPSCSSSTESSADAADFIEAAPLDEGEPAPGLPRQRQRLFKL
ncbi:hypothetical protein ACU4GD_36860 [Cupriavidus basilensis]